MLNFLYARYQISLHLQYMLLRTNHTSVTFHL